jgi:hypothetical protein
MRSACKRALFSITGATEYIPRVPRSGYRRLAVRRGAAHRWTTVQSPERSPRRRPNADAAGAPPAPGRDQESAASKVVGRSEREPRTLLLAARVLIHRVGSSAGDLTCAKMRPTAFADPARERSRGPGCRAHSETRKLARACSVPS